MKNLKNQKGITLVALVVTIIVLLILAGVSLSLVAGSNGIITKATKASDANTVATAKEQVTLQIAEWTTDFYESVYVNKTEDVNKKAGDWIKEEHAGNENAADNSANLTTDNYNFIIESADSTGNYVVRITGSKIANISTTDSSKYQIPSTNSDRNSTTGKDERLSHDIIGYLSKDGKLTWPKLDEPTNN